MRFVAAITIRLAKTHILDSNGAMARKKSLLEQMKSNPRGDWQIADVKKVCKQHGIILRSPTKGSHFTASSDFISGHLTIPAHRPIKPPYIRNLVNLIEAHQDRKGRANDN